MKRSPAPVQPLVQRWQFFALVGAAALGATLLIGYLLWAARQDALQAAQVTALNYARTLEVRMDATFRRTDSILQTMVRVTPPEALAAGGERLHAEHLNRELDSMLSGFDELIALRIVDAQGDQRYVTAAGTTPPANYADRSFFKAYRSDPRADLLFSEVVMGRVSQRPTVVITRPLRDEQGRLLGAVLAPLDLSFFQQQFRKLDIGRNGVVFLRRSEAGQLVLRWPPIDAEVNRAMPPDQPILRAVQSGQAEAVNEYVAFTDRVQRISGTVTVKGYPFFLTVALSTDDMLANWRRLALLTGITWTALLAMAGTLMRRLWRADIERRALATQLRESQRIDSLGTLAGGIAHDFNNIVAAILGNVELARGELDPAHPAQRSLAQVRQAGLRARDLVHQILAFGRRQQRTLVSQPLQPLIEETVALLRPTLPGDVVLDCTLASEALYADVDATQMQQVLMNLCTNAWHALQDRPGHIRIGLAALDVAPATVPAGTGPAPGRHAHLWVRDDGCGMDAATQARIFEPFFTTKATGVGTGLGLSVVHGIVVAHHGTIRVDSAPGRGTTVHLYLPATVAPRDGMPAPPRAEPLPRPPGGGQHLLVVDDDEVILLMVERLLVQAGYRVTALRDARAALAVLQISPRDFDLLLTDFNMPGCNGLELARAAVAARPGMPVLISSGNITDELVGLADAAGVRGLLYKENTLEELVPRVQDLLSAQPTQG